MDTHVPPDIDTLAVNTIRTLAMDAVQKANSGHPGTPMAMAPVVYTLWQNHLNFDPADPIWPNRDRFVLSVGHASMLLYSMLHLTRVEAVDSEYNNAGHPSVTLDDIKQFRQLDSHCPGHPEYHLTSGVETTTGPLGQGVATSVGMAIAQRWLAAHYNRPGFDLFDYRIYALCGDGDMMEGVSGEAASLAAHLKLSNLCWIYDSNRISIEGHTTLAFSEDVGARFQAYGWNVAHIEDANDRPALDALLDRFASGGEQRPTFIVVRSTIAWGAPHKQDTAAAHGEPLGEEEIRLTKKFYGWPEDAKFLVPDGVYDHFAQGIGARGAVRNAAWKSLFERYRQQFPDEARQIEAMERRELPPGWDKDMPTFPPDAKGMAGREASGKVLNAVAPNLPWLLGGAADLSPSTKTNFTFPGAGELEADSPGGRNMHFGVREHAMGAVCNGLALSKLRPFGSGFLIFSDYMKPAIRLSAIMELPTLFIFTHDSIGVGEDGPTHQPVEQLLSLRSIPGLIVLRPADANEVVEAYRLVLQLKHQPACIVLSRQPLPTFDREKYRPAAGVAKGAYVLADPPDGKPEVLLIATGSEVQLCLGAYEALAGEGVRSRVVSMPSWELFEQQDEAYRAEVMPPEILARVAVEQAATIGWDRYAGRRGAVIGMHTFGASAPLKSLLTKFGFTPDAVAEAARKQIADRK
ncbi:MAG: transketolase [Acidisphaera sp.]|nr:transketolase [Acidisphaera sp.]